MKISLLADGVCRLWGSLFLFWMRQKQARKLKKAGFACRYIAFEGLRICLYANPAAEIFLGDAPPGKEANRKNIRNCKFQSARAVLVFLHGFLDSSLGFRRIVSALDKKTPVLLLDVPGFGRSPLPPLREVWHIDGMARMAARLLFGKLGLQQAVFVTHSMGGLLAAHIYLYQKAHFPKARILSLHAIAPSLLRFSTRDRNRIRKGFYTKDLGELQKLLYELGADAKNLPSASVLLALLWEWSFCGYEYLALNTIERESEVFFTEKEIRALDLPVFLYWGKKDKMTPPRIARRLHKALSHSELFWFSKAGHALHLEEAEKFVEKLERRLGN